MKTTIEFKDGHSETYGDGHGDFEGDVMPQVYDGNVSLIDSDCMNIGDDVPVALVQRVIFENN